MVLHLSLAQILVVHSTESWVLRDCGRIDNLHWFVVIISVIRHYVAATSLEQLALQVPRQLVEVLVHLVVKLVRGLSSLVHCILTLHIVYVLIVQLKLHLDEITTRAIVLLVSVLFLAKNWADVMRLGHLISTLNGLKILWLQVNSRSVCLLMLSKLLINHRLISLEYRLYARFVRANVFFAFKRQQILTLHF